MGSLRPINFFGKFINDVRIYRKLKQTKKQAKKRVCGNNG